MRIIRLYFALALSLTVGPSISQTTEENLINAASLFSGSYMRATPRSFTHTNLLTGSIKEYTPEALFDQSPKMWCSRSMQPFPHVFDLELTETFEISKLEFDNNCEYYRGISAREVKIEFATTVTNPEFKQIGVFTLKEMAKSAYNITPADARVIRISILSNHGNLEFTELAEFKALGVPKTQYIKTINIDGNWNSNWGNVTFNQNQNLFDGQYVYNNGTIKYGGIGRNQITYTWVEKVINREGHTVMFLNEEGNRLTGVWCYDNNWTDFGFWILHRTKKSPFEEYEVSSNEKPATVNNRVVDEMNNELIRNKKLVLYGINFKTNSADLYDESMQVLVQLAELLKTNANLKVRIEGHTDNIGTADYNRTLSQKRTEAVKNYLYNSHGIAMRRMVPEGKGEGVPIADNDTEVGKSANRRVEIYMLE